MVHLTIRTAEVSIEDSYFEGNAAGSVEPDIVLRGGTGNELGNGCITLNLIMEESKTFNKFCLMNYLINSSQFGGQKMN